jgi:hypothetical protein
MKKRNILLLVAGGIILAVILFSVLIMQSPEAKTAFWHGRWDDLNGTWSMNDDYGEVFSITFDFDEDTITIDNDGETMSGTFVINKNVITIDFGKNLLEMPFEVKDDLLYIQVDDATASGKKIN